VLAANAGISEEMLAKISDEDLMALVKETLNSQGVSQAATVAQTSSATSADLDQIKNMTPTQIRQLLAQSGVSTDILDKTSDANLMALVSQTLTSISNSTQ
jgi:DNA-binding transcriptional regulator YiaG